jgi:transposase
VSTLTIIGLDIAKSSFQIHGIAASGRPTLRKKLSRGKVLEFFANLPACLIGMEACGGAHYWARELTKLGHEVRLMPPQYVKPYVKTHKHDAADAEGCCEAVRAAGDHLRRRRPCRRWPANFWRFRSLREKSMIGA